MFANLYLIESCTLSLQSMYFDRVMVLDPFFLKEVVPLIVHLLL
jgi:hypothetical protein